MMLPMMVVMGGKQILREDPRQERPLTTEGENKSSKLKNKARFDDNAGPAEAVAAHPQTAASGNEAALPRRGAWITLDSIF